MELRELLVLDLSRKYIFYKGWYRAKKSNALKLDWHSLQKQLQPRKFKIHFYKPWVIHCLPSEKDREAEVQRSALGAFTSGEDVYCSSPLKAAPRIVPEAGCWALGWGAGKGMARPQVNRLLMPAWDPFYRWGAKKGKAPLTGASNFLCSTHPCPNQAAALPVWRSELGMGA